MAFPKQLISPIWPAIIHHARTHFVEIHVERSQWLVLARNIDRYSLRVRNRSQRIQCSLYAAGQCQCSGLCFHCQRLAWSTYRLQAIQFWRAIQITYKLQLNTLKKTLCAYVCVRVAVWLDRLNRIRSHTRSIRNQVFNGAVNERRRCDCCIRYNRSSQSLCAERFTVGRFVFARHTMRAGAMTRPRIDRHTATSNSLVPLVVVLIEFVLLCGWDRRRAITHSILSHRVLAPHQR